MPRQILRLAVPALVVLVAEPFYVLVDTAVVGHLGRTALAGLAIGGAVMSLAAWLGTVLAYGTTGRSARQFGSGDHGGAIREGVAASWIALVAGALLTVAVHTGARPLVELLAGSSQAGAVASAATSWLRIASLGIPGILLTMAGHGWMRGVAQVRRPVRYMLSAHLASAALCPLLVYPVGLGMTGSAVANVVAQMAAALLFVRAIAVAARQAGVPLRPHWPLVRRQLTVGRDLFVRGASFQMCFLSAAAVAARFGPHTLGAHQIALQLWMLCAFALDAVAIAAQSLVGAALGAADRELARRTAWRVARIGGACGVAFAVLIGAGAPVLPAAFSADPGVREQALVAWPWFVAMQPLAGIVFALDGVLIGAGDVRYLRDLAIVTAVGCFLPAIWLSYHYRLGLGGLWAALTLFIVARLVGLVRRLRGHRWVVVGADPLAR